MRRDRSNTRESSGEEGSEFGSTVNVQVLHNSLLLRSVLLRVIEFSKVTKVTLETSRLQRGRRVPGFFFATFR